MFIMWLFTRAKDRVYFTSTTICPANGLGVTHRKTTIQRVYKPKQEGSSSARPKEGTSRSRRRVHAGDKPTPVTDKITADKTANGLEAPDLVS